MNYLQCSGETTIPQRVSLFMLELRHLEKFARALGLVLALAPCSLAISIQHNRADSGAVPFGDPLFGGVGALYGNGRICTAAAISPTVILTAAHCVGGSGYTFQYQTDNGYGAAAIGQTLVHPSYQVNQSGGFNAFGDIALGFLNTPLPPDVEIYAIWQGALPVGAAIVLNGFGRTSNGQTGITGNAGVHRFGYNFIEGVSYGGTAFESAFDFQAGPPAGCKLCTDIPQGQGTVGRFESIITPGDSGGPVLFSGDLDFQTRVSAPITPGPGKGATPILIGINSYSRAPSNGAYGTVVGFTFVGAYADWIRQYSPALALMGELSGPIENVAFTSTSEVLAFDPEPFPNPVPEPSTGLLAAGALATGWAWKRLRKRS
jgi:hypothetical protein